MISAHDDDDDGKMSEMGILPAELVDGDLSLPIVHLLPQVQLDVVPLHLLLQHRQLLFSDSTPGCEIEEGDQVGAGVDKDGGARQGQLPSVTSFKCLQPLELVGFQHLSVVGFSTFVILLWLLIADLMS